MKRFEQKIKQAWHNYLNGFNHAAAMFISDDNVVVKNIKF